MAKTALTNTEAEREAIQKALQKIYEIRQIKNERRIQVLTFGYLECLSIICDCDCFRREYQRRIKNQSVKALG